MNDAAYRSAPTAEDAVARIVEAEQAKDILRFITCGSVDDGKSTLIGRLLYDAELILEDHLAQLTAESASRPSTEDGLDFSLLVDGLQAEREQGITIDVAYRFFETARRKFVVADTPGHEQYTRNMVTGASNAELALVLIDARKGVLPQTRRHTHICALLGIRHMVAVINKMDLVGYDRDTFAAIEAEMRGFAARVGIEDLTVIPISALKGDNVADRSARMDWYEGPALMDFLETVEVDGGAAGTQGDGDAPLRFPVQWVNRPDLDFRGFSGTLARGTARVGQRVTVARSGHEAEIARIVTFDGDLPSASTGDAVTLVLDREIDVSRGDMLVAADDPPCHADQFQAHLVWMADAAMMPGRTYLLQIGTDRIPATVTALKYRIDVNNLDHLAATTLGLNELGVANLAAERPVAFDAYTDCRETGGFVLIDRLSNATVAAGMIDHPLRRATNLSWQAFDVDARTRAVQKGQTPAILWFTGLSGSGKSTIANLVEKRLFAEGRHLYVLDGDNVRHGLNKDLGFTEADRVENIRRVAEVARLMAEAGLIVLVSFISPFRRERNMAREIAEEHRFVEIFVDTPIEVCEARDPKGLYRKAKAGQIRNFTGIDSPYEAPDAPEIRIDTTAMSPEEAADLVVRTLGDREPR